ncbi:MAG: hypothetical protein ABEN55_22350, partial [Bradymonadaceae bacterium]
MTEVKEDYQTVVNTSDDAYYDMRRVRLCVAGYIDTQRADTDWSNYTPDHLPAGPTKCSNRCYVTSSTPPPEPLNKIYEKYGKKCGEALRKFEAAQYRESLEGFSKGVRETKWSRLAFAYYTQLEILEKKLAFGKKKEWETELLEAYRKRLEELNSGETGKKLDAYRAFERQHADLVAGIGILAELFD